MKPGCQGEFKVYAVLNNLSSSQPLTHGWDTKTQDQARRREADAPSWLGGVTGGLRQLHSLITIKHDQDVVITIR